MFPIDGFQPSGATWGDYDNDGWPDLYVANDAGPNFLYHNKHDGTFEDIGLFAGVALSGDGMEQGSMGVDWGDYVHEGRLSMIVTNFVEQGSTLYHNLGKQNFGDVSVRAKLIKPTYPYGALLSLIWITTAGSTYSSSTAMHTHKWTLFPAVRPTASPCCFSATITTVSADGKGHI
jgi:hypothetical protein